MIEIHVVGTERYIVNVVHVPRIGEYFSYHVNDKIVVRGMVVAVDYLLHHPDKIHSEHTITVRVLDE